MKIQRIYNMYGLTNQNKHKQNSLRKIDVKNTNSSEVLFGMKGKLPFIVVANLLLFKAMLTTTSCGDINDDGSVLNANNSEPVNTSGIGKLNSAYLKSVDSTNREANEKYKRVVSDLNDYQEKQNAKIIRADLDTFFEKEIEINTDVKLSKFVEELNKLTELKKTNYPKVRC